MSIIYLLSLTLSILFFGLSSIHVYWALGGEWGIQASIPTNEKGQKLFEPGIFGSSIVAIGLMIFAVFVLIKAGILIINIPWMITQYGLWIIAGIFATRSIGDFKYVGFFKHVQSSDFGRMDTRFYSPLCLVIALLAILVELFI